MNPAPAPFQAGQAARALVFALAAALAVRGAPPAFRLPDTAQPLACALELTIRPDQERFQGLVEIDTLVARPTDELWLHASGLTIQDAAFLPQEGGLIPATPHLEGEGFLGLALQRPLAAGRGRIRIHYSGPLHRPTSGSRTHGLFAEQEDGRWYVYSQFESISAREAFPCFDEPGFKVPWQVTLRVPTDLVAVATAPEASEQIGEDGLKTVRFEPTRPLPCYTLALGVGPFDLMDLGKAGRKGTPLRLILPKGHREQAAYAAKALPEILVRLEDHIGMPYPYEKLDSLISPHQSPRAMENAGLLTYAEGFLLLDPGDHLTPSFERKFMGVNLRPLLPTDAEAARVSFNYEAWNDGDHHKRPGRPGP